MGEPVWEELGKYTGGVGLLGSPACSRRLGQWEPTINCKRQNKGLGFIESCLGNNNRGKGEGWDRMVAGRLWEECLG